MSIKNLTYLISLTGLASGLSAQQIDLESTFLGDKEQPSVSVFIPWDGIGGPDKLYRPIESVSGNVLEPLDREVLERSVGFYQQLALEATPSEAGN